MGSRTSGKIGRTVSRGPDQIPADTGTHGGALDRETVSDFKWPTMHIMTVPGSDSRRDALVQWWQKSGEGPGRVCPGADPRRRGGRAEPAGRPDCHVSGARGPG